MTTLAAFIAFFGNVVIRDSAVAPLVLIVFTTLPLTDTVKEPPLVALDHKTDNVLPVTPVKVNVDLALETYVTVPMNDLVLLSRFHPVDDLNARSSSGTVKHEVVAAPILETPAMASFACVATF